jgi:uncharacterized phage protein (TIGR01671 family)
MDFIANEIDHDQNLNEPISIEHFELMQYTGLKDKNGKEIFEGDIISVCNGSINCVEWMDDPREVKYTVNKGYNLPLFCWDENGESNFDSTHWCEVIGNIYENPVLI